MRNDVMRPSELSSGSGGRELTWTYVLLAGLGLITAVAARLATSQVEIALSLRETST